MTVLAIGADVGSAAAGVLPTLIQNSKSISELEKRVKRLKDY